VNDIVPEELAAPPTKTEWEDDWALAIIAQPFK
jgi:hypothetical protein